MPLRKFEDKDFDSFVRAKFENAPVPPLDKKAWLKFAIKRGRPKYLFLSGIILLIFIIVGFWWWSPPLKIDENSDSLLGEKLTYNKDKNFIDRSSVNSIDNKRDTINNLVDNNEGNSIDQPSVNSIDNIESNSKYFNSNGDTIHNLNDNNEGDLIDQTLVNLVNVADNKENTINDLDDNEELKYDILKDILSSEKENSDDFEELKSERSNTNISSPSNSKLKVPVLEGSASDAPKDSKNQQGYINNEVKKLNTALLNNETTDRTNNLIGKSADFIYEIPPVFFKLVEVISNTSDSGLVEGKDTGKLDNRLVVSALVNGDFSTVKFKDFTSPGLGIGVRLSYRLSRRFSITGGFIKTKRIYSVSDREDYTLPRSILDIQGWPEGVDAKCNITEIPLGLRYDFITFKKSNFYGQLSSSTFLMDREFYDFRLGENANTTYVTSWEVENKNKHVFNIIGVSFGFEKYLTKKIGVGVEVYWQTTLDGIGIYQVDLNSLGNQILFNYRF